MNGLISLVRKLIDPLLRWIADLISLDGKTEHPSGLEVRAAVPASANGTEETVVHLEVTVKHGTKLPDEQPARSV
jgi:hypothetical protein